jgi:hypothetical protein
MNKDGNRMKNEWKNKEKQGRIEVKSTKEEEE